MENKENLLSPDNPMLIFGKPHSRYKILFLTSINGLEISCIQAINELIMANFFKNLDISDATIIIIIANPEAVKLRKIFIDEELEFKENEENIADISYETKRFQFLCRQISTCDLVIDLHSTIIENENEKIINKEIETNFVYYLQSYPDISAAFPSNYNNLNFFYN